jgi:8-oxo-dGTP pyrophosphatase MutT (NUDIX family)
MKKRASYQVSLKLLLRNDSNEILVLKAVDSGSFAGFYDLPGGRIDIDEVSEKFETVLAREVAEEIGVVNFTVAPKPVAVGRHRILAALTRSGKDTDVLYLFFEASYRGGNVSISAEHTEYKWVNLAEVDLSNYFTSGILEGVQMYLAD